MSLAREKQAAGWFWLMGRNLLTLALVDLTEYGESRINVLGTLKNDQAKSLIQKLYLVRVILLFF